MSEQNPGRGKPAPKPKRDKPIPNRPDQPSQPDQPEKDDEDEGSLSS